MKRMRAGAALVLTWALVVACDGKPETQPASAPAPASPPSAERDPALPELPHTDVDAPPVRRDGTVYAESELMGTHVSVNVFKPPDRTAQQTGRAIQAAFDEMARIESLMSEWQPQTELSRLNANSGGDWMKVSPELAEVLARSVEIARATDGAFDPTFLGVGKLWKFDVGSKPPSPEAIAAALPLVGWSGIEVDRDTSRARLARKGAMVGLGAIAKGYAVDRASAVLLGLGFRDHVVEAGGDTYVSGTKNGKPWVVGIQKPVGTGIVGAIPSSDRSVVTSGDYQRFFDYEGVRYAHILDPKTGWPIPSDRAPTSVTLVAANATDADAYATAVAVMGVEAGMAYVEKNPDIEAVIITHDGRRLVSSGLLDELIGPDGKLLGADTQTDSAPSPPAGAVLREPPK